jgi:hypothetical protein
MIRMIAYLAALGASALGWRLGLSLGPFGALVAACLAAAVALYLTRRILRGMIEP